MQRWAIAAVVLGVGVGSIASAAAQQAAVPAAASPAAAKEVADLMMKSKLECVATESAVFGGYAAAFLVPGAKLTVVSARFKDTTSMTYKLYQKDCVGAYADLSAAVDALDRVVVDDISADGLVAMPKKDTPRDSITREGKTIKLDGEKNALKQMKMTQEEFAKTFASADETYTQLLHLLSKELKK